MAGQSVCIWRRPTCGRRRNAGLGAKAGDLYRPVQIGAALATGAIVALSYEAAKRAEAVNGAFSQIFRDMPEKAAAATSAISTEFGRLETDIKDNFTQIGGVLAGLGVKGEQALTIIDQLQRRALDLAAFKDVAGRHRHRPRRGREGR